MMLGEIARSIGGELHGPSDMAILGPGSLDTNTAGTIVFAIDENYLRKAESSAAAALLLPRNLTSSRKPFIQVDDPRAAFMLLLQRSVRPLPLKPGTHEKAVIDPAASVSSQAQIGAFAVVERGAKIGAGCRIYPFAYVGEDCELEESCTIYPHAVLYQNVRLGKGTIVHAGAVLGADGFGFVWDGKQRIKVPQVGGVVLGDDCEVGALTAIDRATIGDTNIGRGTKFDNFVQVAHNVSIGDDCVFAAQVGVGGSTKIGDRVEAAGQVGVADHMTISHDAKLAARAAVLQDVEAPGEYIGIPARPAAEGVRAMLLFNKLPDLFRRLRKLEKRVERE